MASEIVIIQFSSRISGNCTAISERISEYYVTKNITHFVVDDQVIRPCNGCDYECLQAEKKCPQCNDKQNQIMDAICSADLAYFVIPNYCGFPSANYFAFNERSVGYFDMDRSLMQRYMNVPKRFIVISNTEGENFVNALKQQVSGEPEILYLKTSKYHKRRIAGDMMDAPEANADLDAFLRSHTI